MHAESIRAARWRTTSAAASCFAASSVLLLLLFCAYMAGSAHPIRWRGRVLAIQLQTPSVWAPTYTHSWGDSSASNAALGDLPAVDAVLVWVNTSDPNWRRASRNATGGPKPPTSRGEVLLAVASLADFAPWLRRIFVVSMDQQFNLNLFSEDVRRKVSFIDHRDIIPAHFLPTFNSLAIELFLHNIPGLAETFIYSNDDMVLARPLLKQELFDPGTSKFKSMLMPWDLLHGNTSECPPNGFCWMYSNTRVLLESKLGEVPKYGWHAGMLLHKEAYRLAWRLFGPQLNNTASHAVRTYRPLAEGGDIMGPMLFSMIGLMRGIQAVDLGHTFRMLAGVPADLAQQLAEVRAAGAAATAVGHGRRGAGALEGSSASSLQSAPAGNNTQPAPRKPMVLWMNFQAMNKASKEDLGRWCQLLVQEHRPAFNQQKLGCMCTSPVGVGMAC